MITVPKAPVSRWSNMLVLPENRSAVRAVRTTARALLAGKRPPITPLVLHGPPGTGKSHLIAALVAQLAAGQVVLTARTLSAGEFARSDGSAGFADRDLIECDLLAVEDVQLLPLKDASAVGALLDNRVRRRKATVVTANAGPAGLGQLPRALTSRLSAGLVVQVGLLSQSSRRVLLEEAATARQARLGSDALDYIATQAGGSARTLLGLLNTVAPRARGLDPLDRDTVEQILAGTGQPTSPGPTVDAIVKRVATAFGVNEKDILGISRLRKVLVPRQVAMHLAREVCGLSLPRLGAVFGRDHSTVLHACRKVEADMACDQRLAATVRQLRNELG